MFSSRLLRSRMNGNDWGKRLVIEPLFPGSLKGDSAAASLDFHLGNRFTILRRERAAIHDPVGSSSSELSEVEFHVPFGEIFVLHPGELALGTTLEWFRFPMDLMGYVVGRSIWGRTGLLPATAIAVQPGSSGTITLELHNSGPIAVALRPGIAIGQLFFHETGEEPDLNLIRSSFSASLRPTLGDYHLSEQEKFFLQEIWQRDCHNEDPARTSCQS